VAGDRPLAVGARRLLLGGYALATFLSFPHPVGGRVLDLGLLCAWLAPALLVAGLRGLRPSRAAVLGFAASLVAHTAVLHWIYVVTVTYGHASPLVGVLAPAGLAAYVALFSAGFGAAAAWLAARRAAGPLALALLWTVLDHLRSFALSGFPWATLGYAQHQNTALLGLVPWTGVYGLSFVTVLGGAALAELARERASRRAWAALGTVLALHALGGLLTAADSPPDGLRRVRVAVLQGNIDQGVKWSSAWAERTLAIHEELSRRAAGAGASIILWPETAVPGSVEADAGLRERLAALARETRATLVVGGVGVEPADGGFRFYDSAFLVEPSGRLADRYDKAHLVPFGEYVPLRGLLGRFASALARGIAPDDVSAGPGPRPLAVGGGAGDAVPAGVPICYELLFPDLMRRFVAGGAEVLFAITNDAWYGRTGAPYQFLAITALRSAENRVWTARAANTGVSAFIDHRGRVRERTGIFERGLLVADVPLRPPPAGGSFYTRHGDVFAWGCWIGAAAATLAGRRRRPATGE
jgi:apolipoprotein N-acyltransferase